MRRLLRSRKGSMLILIPLIFLILWVGALTFEIKTEFKIEQLQIVCVDFNADDTIDIHVRNTGTATVTITDARVDAAIIDVTDVTIDSGESYEVTGISYAWINGTAYNIAVVTNTGATFTYRATSPSL